jgi:hypothetical protein
MILKTALLGVALLGQAPGAPQGKETVITFASGGGLRNWQPGPMGSRIVYVQDRTQRWYRVLLTGDCIRGPHSTQAFRYITDNNGQFDRFSQVSSRDTPGAVCGVTSIQRTTPPKGQPGYVAPKP